ncbi:TIGR02536 family ethanolamine utilization protein [Clostridium sp.]|uniref:TIGR02536 family ethanolamine utilization protein n=1 Tax=Clostridium sp. TaxID=1506 RepID=UPI003F3382BE
MNFDNIVDLIVEEVYKKIKESPKNSGKNKLAVVIGENKDNNSFNIVDNTYSIVQYNENIKDCDVVIVPFLCIKGMANLANLTTTTKSEYFIIKMLMSGKKVYVLEDGLHYRKYKNTAPKALYNKYLEFEDKLINFGVEIIQSSNIENKLLNSSSLERLPLVNNVGESEKSGEIRNKKLISEADLRKIYMSGSRVIFVDKKSIITPLANDFIRINNINIIKN